MGRSSDLSRHQGMRLAAPNRSCFIRGLSEEYATPDLPHEGLSQARGARPRAKSRPQSKNSTPLSPRRTACFERKQAAGIALAVALLAGGCNRFVLAKPHIRLLER